MYTHFMIGEDESRISEARLGQILSAFQTSDLVQINKQINYYNGQQDILYKAPVDTGRPDNRIVTNFCKIITNNYVGFLTGKPISFMGENVEDIQEILDYNDVDSMMSAWLKQALITGRGFLINYIDGDGKQRIQVLDSSTCIPIYSDSIEGNLKWVIRFWQDNSAGTQPAQIQYFVEVYGDDENYFYKSSSGFNSFELQRVETNFYKQCPITVFTLTEDDREPGIFAPAMSLQDAYNTLTSGGIDNYEDFADCYLVLKGLTADAEDLKKMKESRCLLLDGDDTSAEYLTKNISDTQVTNMLATTTDMIYKVCSCPDFSDETFGNATSGTALRFKLLAFENACGGIQNQMTKSIQRMIELFCEILNLSETEKERTFRDIKIVFTRNLPNEDISVIATAINALRGILSQETLISLLPEVDNPAEELEKLKKEQDAVRDLYEGWDVHEHEAEDEE